VLFAVVVIFVFSSSAWLSGFFSRLLYEAEGLADIDSPDVSVLAGKTADEWKKGKFAVLLFFDKEETDNIDASLDKLINAAKNKDEKEYTAAKIQLRYEIKRMKDMLDIRFENIF
ncbi:MAG: DUF4363 family protein, partial [Clostridia bacterium]|nr:DUF4363 family protein [Clostridia bacterium]